VGRPAPAGNLPALCASAICMTGSRRTWTCGLRPWPACRICKVYTIFQLARTLLVLSHRAAFLGQLVLRLSPAGSWA
jgi:hypothetical protein